MLSSIYMSCKVYLDGIMPEKFYNAVLRDINIDSLLAYEEKRFIELISDNGYFIIENNKINKYDLVESDAEIKKYGDNIFIFDKSFYKNTASIYNNLPINCIESFIIRRKYTFAEDITIVVEGNERMYNFVSNNFYFLFPASTDSDAVCKCISTFLKDEYR